MNWLDYETARHHHTMLIDEARFRRILLIARHKRQSTSMFASCMDRIGRTMIAWGWRLRARYGEAEMVKAE